ncbi:DEAD/DEAH box helicase [Chloroflexota bacterium]
MPIKLSIAGAQKIILDSNDEPALLSEPKLNDILLAFTATSFSSTRLIVDVGTELIESCIYIMDETKKHGIEVLADVGLVPILQTHRKEIEFVNDIINSAHDSSTNPPSLASSSYDLPYELLPHQRQGLNQAINIQNLAEFSVPGSGKTAIVLSTFEYWRTKGQIRKLLVIGPLSCFEPWESEIKRCLGSDFVSMRWSGSATKRATLIPQYHSADIILCSYDTARGDVEMLQRLIGEISTLLVLDESHYVKSFAVGARGTAVLRLSPYATKRMILTGTPAPHSLLDLWAQFAFLWPSGKSVLIGNRQKYQTALIGSETPARDLRRRLAPFFHRTTQGDLGLPAPFTHFEIIKDNAILAEQRKIIQLIETRVRTEAKQKLESIRDQDIVEQWQRARIIRLLQAASNPGLLLKRLDADLKAGGDIDVSDLQGDLVRFRLGELKSSKVEWVVRKARDLISQDNKVVIWTWWVDNIRLLSELLADLHPLQLFGEIKPYEEESDDSDEESRERNIREFRMRKDRPVLIANPSACAEAISLHRECHHAIYLDRTFNCGQFLQSMNRIHRVGLPEHAQTHYWIPLLDCAVERSVERRLKERQTTMYEFLGDNSRIIGSDLPEETGIADDYREESESFKDILSEIESDSSGNSQSPKSAW